MNARKEIVQSIVLTLMFPLLVMLAITNGGRANDNRDTGSAAASGTAGAWAVRTASPASGPAAAQHLETGAAKYVSNLPLLTHNREPVRFYSDLIRGKVVLINVIYTACASSCSLTTANLVKVQEYLGSDVGQTIHMISISVDPRNDTPEVLKQYALAHQVKPGWQFVTGNKDNIDWVLYKLGLYVEDKLEHSDVLIIGNDGTGQWVKMAALSDPAQIAAEVRRVAAAKKT
jgi:protein SCO1